MATLEQWFKEYADQYKRKHPILWRWTCIKHGVRLFFYDLFGRSKEDKG